MVISTGITPKHDGLYGCYLSRHIIAIAVTVKKSVLFICFLKSRGKTPYFFKVSSSNRFKGVMLSPHYDAYKPVKCDL